jgi:transglutaminase-like putative cysteine protease
MLAQVRILCCALAMFAPGLARAAGPLPDAEPPLVIVDADNRYDVAADGSYTQTYHFAFRPTNDAAARREAQQAISYSPTLEQFSIVEAYTQKADGRVLPVAAAGIHDQLPFGEPDLALFSDQRQKVILFPDVAGGDTLVYTWRRVVSRPVFPGQFMTNIYMSRDTPWQALDLTVSAPAAMKLLTEAHGFAADISTASDRVVRHWHASLPVAGDEAAALGPYDRLPRVFVSSFSGYDALAAAYASLARPKAEPTPRVRALAEQITQGAGDRREQARRLYDWVSLHIRYIAVYLDIGALEPHDADTVLANGYGDCKDHVVLFDALLAARGIAADLAMVNLGDHYSLSGPPTFAQLNHAISYLPEFDLYADTTAGTAPFGTLPFEVYGKPVIHAVTQGHALRRTPMLAADAAVATLRTTERLDVDGSIAGTSLTQASGPFSGDLRHSALWAQENGPIGAAAMRLRALGTDGSGAFAFTPPDQLDGDFRMSGSFQLDARPEILDGDSFVPPVGLRLLVRAGELLLGPVGDRRIPDSEAAPCFPGTQIEDLTLDLPPGRRVGRLPTSVTIENAAVSYRSRWAQVGDTLTQHRELVSKVQGPVCTGATRLLAAQALTLIRRDERRRVALADE